MGRAEIQGSAAPVPPAGLTKTAVPPDEPLDATLVLRRKVGADELTEHVLAGERPPLSREEAAGELGANPEDVSAVRSFLEQYGLRVAEVDEPTRRVKVAGCAENFERAFGIRLCRFDPYISYEGPVTVPDALAGIIVAVLGLDTRPVARRRS